MKALFIGGTGTISTAISRQLAAQGTELYLINRGNRNAELPGSIHFIKADINDEAQVAELIKDMSFDVVCEFDAWCDRVISTLEQSKQQFCQSVPR